MPDDLAAAFDVELADLRNRMFLEAQVFADTDHDPPLPEGPDRLRWEPSGGVRFFASYYPTCYRRGPFRLLVEVELGPSHHRWGCFDDADQPMRYYHNPECLFREAQTLASVLWADRQKAGPIPVED